MPRLTPVEILERIDRTWSDWLAALDLLSADEMSIPGVCGVWSATEMMAHIAGWDRHAALYAELSAAGASLDDARLRGVNRDILAEFADLSPEAARKRMEDIHADVCARVEALGAVQASWVSGDTYRHYPEHAAQIRNWVAAYRPSHHVS